jgi:DnaJ-class molecular chaperone
MSCLYDVSESAISRAIEVYVNHNAHYRGVQKSLIKYAKCNMFITSRDSGGVIKIAKVTCQVCRGSGKLPVTREPKAESHGEETVGECPMCHGKGQVDKEG